VGVLAPPAAAYPAPMLRSLPSVLTPSRRFWPTALGVWLLLSAALPLLHLRVLGKERLTTAIATELVVDHQIPTLAAARLPAQQMVQQTLATSASAPLALIGSGLLIAAALHVSLTLVGVAVHRPTVFAAAAWGVIATATLELLGWAALATWAWTHPTAPPTWPVDTWMAPTDALNAGRLLRRTWLDTMTSDSTTPSVLLTLAEGLTLTKSLLALLFLGLLRRKHPHTAMWRLSVAVAGWCILSIGARGGIAWLLQANAGGPPAVPTHVIDAPGTRSPAGTRHSPPAR
jgi:hypothetical protein